MSPVIDLIGLVLIDSSRFFMYEAGVRRCTKRVSTLNIYIKNSVSSHY